MIDPSVDEEAQWFWMVGKYGRGDSLVPRLVAESQEAHGRGFDMMLLV